MAETPDSGALSLLAVGLRTAVVLWGAFVLAALFFGAALRLLLELFLIGWSLPS